MPRKPSPTADDLTLRAGVLLLHAEAARIAEARRVERETRGILPATTSAGDVWQRIEAGRNKRRRRQSEARGRKEQQEAAILANLPRHCPQRRVPAGRWQDQYSPAEFERQFGYPPPAAEDEPDPLPAPGDTGIPF